MSVYSAAINLSLTVTETLATNVPNVPGASANVQHGAFNLATSLSPTTTPAASEHAAGQATMVTGTPQQLNLTSILGVNNLAVNADTKKPVAMLWRAPKTNVAAITITQLAGATGYMPFGATGDQITLRPGMTLTWSFEDTATNTMPAVAAAGARIIQAAGTTADILKYEIVWG